MDTPNVQARHSAGIIDLTPSVWHYIDTNIARYINPTYDPADATLGDPVLLHVCPALFALDLWRDYFMRVWPQFLFGQRCSVILSC